MAWRERLIEMGAWTEPEGEPIADPPGESVRQIVGGIGRVESIPIEPTHGE